MRLPGPSNPQTPEPKPGPKAEDLGSTLPPVQRLHASADLPALAPPAAAKIDPAFLEPFANDVDLVSEHDKDLPIVPPSPSANGPSATVPMSHEKRSHIRNSTAEFLIFTKQAGENSIEVRVEGETVWLSQKQMAALFEVTVPTINEHLATLYAQGEIRREATIRNFRIVQKEGGREVGRNVDFCNLDAIIAVGFRVNSERAIQFRQWAGEVIRDFAIKGYVLDKERLKNGAFLSQEYFDNLLAEIREIRASERRFYQKITDIYATAMDYHRDSETTKDFFATVQNKLHFAIHGHTAAEVIVGRADATKDHMGLTTWRNAPHGKILKPDVAVAKNYLSKDEIKKLNRFVGMYLDYAESQAEKGIPMTMADWASKLNAFLQFNQHDILHDTGKVTHEIAKAFAESEFEKYRIVQDRLFESDFDRVIKGEILDA